MVAGRGAPEPGSLEDLQQRVAETVSRSSRWGPEPDLADPISQPCTQAQLDDPVYELWRTRLREETVHNRKVWEWAWICEMVERHAARRGDAGLDMVGFGVGTEPIVGWLVSRGHSVLATDLPAEELDAARWASTNQHASAIGELDPRRIADPAELQRRVRFRPVDMRAVPADLGRFDAMWSSCAIEHLGSLEAGFDFVRSSLEHCRSGGLALHTTELNVSHEEHTVTEGHTVVYRRRDLERFFGELIDVGHRVEWTFNLGSQPLDRRVDPPPFSDHHLKIPLDGVVTTSFGFAIHVA